MRKNLIEASLPGKKKYIYIFWMVLIVVSNVSFGMKVFFIKIIKLISNNKQGVTLVIDTN